MEIDDVINIFPTWPKDPFYQQFDDPLRAFWNLPALYAFYLENPCNEPHEIDHITYARLLAGKNFSELPSKSELLKTKKGKK